MSTQQKYKGGKKARKLGRNKNWCASYRLSGTVLKNKRRKLRRHLKQERHAGDNQAMIRFKELNGTVDW